MSVIVPYDAGIRSHGGIVPDQERRNRCYDSLMAKISAKIGAEPSRERFQDGARDYAAYLETPQGRLRTDLAFANLQEFLPHPAPPRLLRALDLGSGAGTMAVRLAQLGVHVTLLDSSPAMLELAKQAARAAGAAANIMLRHGDAAQIADVLTGESFDLILCHNVLEFLDEPAAVLQSVAQAMRDSTATLSVLVRNRAGEVFKSAIQTGDLAAAEHCLTAEWGTEALFGSPVRLFAPDSLRAALRGTPLTVIAERGVRVVSDYLTPTVLRDGEYARILALERKLGGRPEFAAVARYTQYLIRRIDPTAEDCA
jgi:S-adenosylmethionine-dependent methyltransferase